MTDFIPKQLQKNEFRFIKVAGDKRAIEKVWQKVNNYLYSDSTFLDFIDNQKRYGVVCGYGNLVVVDFDDEATQDKIVPLLPETFTTKSAGKGLLHLWFIADTVSGFRINDFDGKRIADVQGNGTYILGPNSQMNSGRIYEIVKNREIAKVSMSKLREVFSPYLGFEKIVKANKLENVTDPEKRAIMERIKVPQLLAEWGVETRKNPTDCPFHDSSAGKCLSFTEDLWNCFHCGEGGTVFELMMLKNNIPYYEAKKLLAERVGVKLVNLDVFVENKEEIAEQYYKLKPYFYDSIGLFWFWNEQKKCYERKDELQILNEIKAKAGNRTFQITQNKVYTEILRALKLVGRSHEPSKWSNTWIQFGGTVYDYKNGDRFAASSRYFNANPIPWELGVSDETPTIDGLFTEWVGAENVKTLKQTIALGCLNDYPLHRIICFVGRGMNGKGVFLRFLATFMGIDNVCSSNLSKLIKSNFEVSKLYKKLICLMGETDFATLKDTSLLKQLSGQDLVSAEFKGKDSFDFENTATLFIATNSLPATLDRTDGFYRRWLLIDFPNQFKEGQDPLDKIPNKEYSCFARQIIGLVGELVENGRFDNDGDIEQRRQRYEEKSNPLNIFLKSYQRDINSDIPFFEFYDEFNSFCKEYGYRELSKKNISQILEESGYQTEKKDHKRDDGTWTRWTFIVGIKKVSTTSTHSTLHSTLNVYKRNRVGAGVEREERVETEIIREERPIIKYLKQNQYKDNYENAIKTFGEEKIKEMLESGDLFQSPIGFLRVLE